MNKTKHPQLRLLPAPDAATLDMLYRTFNDVLVPLEKVRTQYFRNLNEQSFLAELNSGRIQLPILTLDTSRKAIKYVHLRHVAALIDICAYRADENLSALTSAPDESPD
ncbi:transcriptional regulator PrtN [Pseudomonas sp. StFLB209]|uniref:pyocin activator PrtN family protein n=1 Tax=Pseudomonas sp. StFLB209 TaxID=1028989 RepID=UPI0004F84A50|nr:pyocin activator PrtN family protein [Pseudomonas sp. StFLB209]BAP44738.1 transcriptional regulator PrtN [Pseudomonas sp. StFLB209]